MRGTKDEGGYNASSRITLNRRKLRKAVRLLLHTRCNAKEHRLCMQCLPDLLFRQWADLPLQDCCHTGLTQVTLAGNVPAGVHLAGQPLAALARQRVAQHPAHPPKP